MFKDLNTRQNPGMKPDLCPHILLPLDERACGAINQTQRGQTHPLKALLRLGSVSDPSEAPTSPLHFTFESALQRCKVISSLNNFAAARH